MSKYRHHESASIFPLCKKAIKELTISIKLNGLLEPIEIYKDEIIDGRSREIACLRAGVEPDYVDVIDIVDDTYSGDTVQYSLDKNLHRRHLTSAQSAAAAVKATELRAKFEKAAKERQKEAASRAGKASGASRRGETNVRAARPQRLDHRSRDDLAKVFGTSGRQIQRMTRVRRDCIPEVFEAVEDGVLTATEADEQFAKGKPKGEQYAALKTLTEEKTKPKEKKREEKRAKEESTDPERRAAVRAETETFNFFKTSKLVLLKKSNPHRTESFRTVINWLRRISKEI